MKKAESDSVFSIDFFRFQVHFSGFGVSFSVTRGPPDNIFFWKVFGVSGGFGTSNTPFFTKFRISAGSGFLFLALATHLFSRNFVGFGCSGYFSRAKKSAAVW